MNTRNGLGRRSFLAWCGAGAATVAGASMAAAQANSKNASAAASSLRVLGRTGLKVSSVGVGAMQTTEPAVLQAAFERGVNYVDTARAYKGGRNEEVVGQALKGWRDKVIVATKVRPGLAEKADLLKCFDESRAALGVDVVDVLQLHDLRAKAAVMAAGPREALKELKAQGKAKFLGVTTHTGQVEVINAVLDDPEKLFDVVLVAYNFTSPPELKEAIARAAKAKIGIVAMKTQAGGYKTDALGPISPHQAALKWVLTDPHVATTIPSMSNLDQVREDTEVMGMKLTAVDRQILDRYASAVAPAYCRLCASCEGTCPRGVAVADVNRALMYAQGYGDLELARGTYAALPRNASAAACADCTHCVAQCPNGLDVSAKMSAAQAMFV